MNKLRSMALSACALLLSQNLLAVELVQWERLPIAVPLVKGEERIIFLDKNVRVGVSSQLANTLRVQSAAGALYLLANDEIEPTRLQVQDVETSEVILLDIATVPSTGTVLEPIRILSEGDASLARSDEEGKAIADKQTQALKIPAPIALTRYASQMMYAPLRTVEPVSGITQVPIKVTGDDLPILPTYPVKAKALTAFKMGSYTVTAVKLQNTQRSNLQLDPRDIQGHFYSATFQHNWLGTHGTAEDTTIAYLVTRNGGIENALLSPVLLPDLGSKEARHEK
ncbi:TIGR03749 family integrating conjugative element protein [Pseudomonas sp. C27(2019)]|uniref:TIGR03749 family integrating conjugative element protein n=1 Tax=Pseudomonas sp. C27(2019) TaxID=2604941 RepID=UPI0012480EC0|nr:TIGR03749 family integrating conjugative element protein [Pseudomonas sp. C27(2019)]QEY57765.1 TIGR03749 family integrating conjugative element protein [Pseudomonas sp. C27(2019)]